LLGIPAKVAGCKKVIACVPPDKQTGKINPYVLVSAHYSGIKHIYKVGGAQAIAAMAYGTNTIPKVSKIFGPGNIYVTCAKLLVYGTVDIDAPAGPSEAMIIADDTVPVDIVASDIISQAEHDVNAAAVFLTTSLEFAMAVKFEISEQIKNLKRSEIIIESLERYGATIVCEDIDTCIRIANDYAPEHIQIMTKESAQNSDRIVNAGSVCIGKYSPIAMGDYLSGVNNVIPTGGASKSFSPVSVESFMKSVETQEISREALVATEKHLKIISEIEGLDAHYNSVKKRIDNN
jgi:histidinol dehydrogenase